MTDDDRGPDGLPDLSTLPPALRGGGWRGTVGAAPLTVGRSLAAVASGVLAGLATVVVVLVVAVVASPSGWEGLGVVLLALAGGILVACLVAALVVRAFVRTRQRGSRFSGVFSAALAVLLVAQAALVAGAGSGLLTGPAADLRLLDWVLVPMLWTVPAAAAGVVRARVVAAVAGLGAVVVVVVALLRLTT